MPNYRRLFIGNSYVFITIVTNNRIPILVDNIQFLREAFKDAKTIYDFDIYACVILPEHMHLILVPKIINEYPKIIRAIKYNFSKKINDGGIAIPPYASGQGRRAGFPSCRHKNIWQNRYFEHTIFNENDLYKHLDYIHYNPVKHAHVKNVRDWKFSSFNKFVKMKNYETNWGSVDDVKHIAELEYN